MASMATTTTNPAIPDPARSAWLASAAMRRTADATNLRGVRRGILRHARLLRRHAGIGG